MISVEVYVTGEAENERAMEIARSLSLTEGEEVFVMTRVNGSTVVEGLT